jgi:hypothetical protein
MFDTLRHRRFTWIHLAVAMWLGVFSSYALSMQARMHVGMAFQSAGSQELPCPEHQAAQAHLTHAQPVPQQDQSNTHDCPICHLIGSGWVQSSIAAPVHASGANAAPHGRLFQPVEHLQHADTPPPNF